MVDPPGTAGQKSACYYKLARDNYRDVVQSIADHVLEALQRAGLDGRRLFLLGHSYGAIMAIDCAAALLEYDCPLGGLVLVAAPFTSTLYDYVKQCRKAGPITLQRAWTAYEARPTHCSYRKVRMAYGPLIRSSSLRSAREIRRLMSGDRSCHLATCRVQRQFNESYEEVLEQLSQKTTIIVGEEDRLIPVELVESEAARYDISVIPLPKAGHFPFLCRQHAFRRTILQILH
jgi:pimeloyl-ACP methyl ester carboxylesterase